MDVIDYYVFIALTFSKQISDSILWMPIYALFKALDKKVILIYVGNLYTYICTCIFLSLGL